MADKGKQPLEENNFQSKQRTIREKSSLLIHSSRLSLQSHDSSVFDFSLNLLPEESLVPKKSLSTSFPTPRLKKKMPRLNRGPVINCAVASGI
jgi:hypothetical protein